MNLWKWLRVIVSNPTIRGARTGLVCAIACCLINQNPIVRSLEGQAIDLCFAARNKRHTKGTVVIVGIDSTTIPGDDQKPLMYWSPEIAQVVAYLADRGVSAIGLDFFISNDFDNEDGINSDRGEASLLGETIANLDARKGGSENPVVPVVLPVMYDRDRNELVKPLIAWRGEFDWPAYWSRFGFVELDHSELTIRRQQLWAKEKDTEFPYPYFALSVYAAAHQWQGEKLDHDRIKFESGEKRKARIESEAEHLLPLAVRTSKQFADDTEILINYVGPPGTTPMVRFQDILKLLQKQNDDRSEPLAEDSEPNAAYQSRFRVQDIDWSNKIVLIGCVSPGSPDVHATPYSNLTLPDYFSMLYGKSEPRLMDGIEIHANTIATLEDQAFIYTPLWLSTPLLLIVVGVAMGISLTRVSLRRGALYTFLHHWIWKAISIAGFYTMYWRIEMVSMMLLGVLIYGSVFALRWRWIRKMMGMIKSESIARTLEMDPRSLVRVGEDREVTVFFSDIRNFTKFSSSHSARQVVKLLNSYFAVVVPEFEAHGGALNQYMGDGVMVIFNAPNRQADHALRSVRAALATIEQVHRNVDLWKELDAGDLRVGVGIHTVWLSLVQLEALTGSTTLQSETRSTRRRESKPLPSNSLRSGGLSLRYSSAKPRWRRFRNANENSTMRVRFTSNPKVSKSQV